LTWNDQSGSQMVVFKAEFHDQFLSQTSWPRRDGVGIFVKLGLTV